ncbi:MAG TPA: hypothetical protein G4O12_00275 [Dehalococcoidia bacterium]|nr:hypothetical protein [Dehalococcoidia bacterium]
MSSFIGFSSGIVDPLERVRTRPKALERLVDVIKEMVSRPMRVIIDHADTLQ